MSQSRVEGITERVLLGMRHPGMMASLARGASVAMLVRVVGFAMAYVTQALLARWMGITAYGSYAWVYNNAVLIATFAALGLQSGVVRFIPEYNAKRDWVRLRDMIQVSRRIALLSGLICASIGTLVVGLGNIEFEVTDRLTLLLGIWAIPLVVLMILHKGMLRAVRRMALAFGPPSVLRPLLLVLGAFLLVDWSDGSLSSSEVMGIALVALLLTVVFQAISFERHIPREARRGLMPVNETRTWLRVSFSLLMVTGFLTLLNRIDIFLIGSLVGSTSVGLYNAASNTASLIGFVLVSVNAIAGPTVASLYATQNLVKLQKLVATVMHWILWPSIAVAAVLIGLSDVLLGFFGDEFVAAKAIMVVLIIGQIVNAATGSVGVLLNMTGYQNHTAWVYAWSFFGKLLLSVVAIKVGGVMGAAVVTAATLALQNLWLRRLTMKHLNIDPSIVAVVKLWRASL